MRFDQRAKPRAVNVMDVLKIYDNARRSRRDKMVNGGTKSDALVSEHKTPFECQKIDALSFTLCYFQWHRLLPCARLWIGGPSIIASPPPECQSKARSNC